MRKLQLQAFLAIASIALGISTASAVDITGAGATFPYPVYAKWAEAYKAKTGVKMNYQSIGSGGGIKQIQNKTVDFGASDMPLKPEELDKDGLMQFPDGRRRRRPRCEPRRHQARRTQAHGIDARQHLPRQDHEVERSRHRQAQPRRQAAPISISRSCIAPTARVRRSSGRTTSRR